MALVPHNTVFPGGSAVERLPAKQEMAVGQEDATEKEMATHSSLLAWEIPWTEEPGRLQSMWSQRVFSFRLQSFPASGSFPMSLLFAMGSQSIGASASASVLPMNTQG